MSIFSKFRKLLGKERPNFVNIRLCRGCSTLFLLNFLTLSLLVLKRLELHSKSGYRHEMIFLKIFFFVCTQMLAISISYNSIFTQ